MQLMILVDDAGGAYPRIDHSPWNGCTLADFVMPFFLFIVGVAIALALKVHSRGLILFSLLPFNLMNVNFAEDSKGVVCNKEDYS